MAVRKGTRNRRGSSSRVKIDRSKMKGMGEKFKKKAEDAAKSGNLTAVRIPEGVERWSPTDRRVKLSILPYEVTEDHNPEAQAGEFWMRRKFKLHYGVGVEEKPYVCLRSVGKACPICDYLSTHRNDEDMDEDEQKALRPRDRELYNVLVQSGENQSDEVQVFEYSYHNFGKILEEEVQDSDDPSDASYMDPEAGEDGGRDLQIKWRSKKLGKTTFLECASIVFEEREEPIEDEVLEQCVNLDKCLLILDYDELNAIFLDLETSPTPKEVAAKQEEAEEEEDQEPEAEEEEEEKPRSGRSSRSRSRKREEEPEEEPEEEDEPEEAEEEEEEDGDDEEEEAPEIPEGATECKACGGSGKNTRGRTCVACKGAGYREAPAAKSQTSGKARTKSSGKSGKCPHGHEFGVDTDKYSDCDDCRLWDDCDEAKNG
jgi:hypothetical protein